MKRLHLSFVAAASVCAVTALAGTHVGVGISFGVPAPIVVHRAPPARVVERVTVSPGPGYAWVPGHYTWAGDRWIWMSGMWVVPPAPGAHWVDGTWNPQTQQWIDAHWELAVAPPPAPSAPIVAAPATPPPAVPVATEVVVAEPPPPPMRETVVIERPGPGYIWVHGYWGWEHGRRVWVPSHWELPPPGRVTWVEPRWEHRGHGYVYIHGYWR